jgi:hypothetical protein
VYKVHGRFLRKKYRRTFSRVENVCVDCYGSLNMPFMSVYHVHETVKNSEIHPEISVCSLCSCNVPACFRPAHKCKKCSIIIPNKDEYAVLNTYRFLDSEDSADTESLSSGSVEEEDVDDDDTSNGGRSNAASDENMEGF